MLRLHPFKDDLPIPDVVHPVGPRKHGRLKMAARARVVQLHAELPEPASVWSYELVEGRVVQRGSGETYVGPTIEVMRDGRVTVEWINGVDAAATLPFEVIKTNANKTNNKVPQNHPGRNGEIPPMADMVRNQAHKLHAAFVTHLHGGRTQSDSDGWPDNTCIPGQSAHYTYHNNQAATMLWYHDHSMNVTRLNVFAGLAGAWIVREKLERALHLPYGEFEIPLIIQDRNLDVVDDKYTGQLLHKVEVNGGDGPAEFFGPYSLVNGKIWPKTSVKKGLYRLRLLNGSNARTYRLLFLDKDGGSLNAGIWQIGCDQGLMQSKLPLPETGLILMPAERADLLIDFSAYTGSIYLWNTADAPFGNEPANLPDPADVTRELLHLLLDPLGSADAVDSANSDRRRLFPQVMRFDIANTRVESSARIPADGLATLNQPVIDASTSVRIMGLVEEPPMDAAAADATTMLVFWEFMPVMPQMPAPDGALVVNFKYWHPGKGAYVVQQYWKGASEFYDQINWIVNLNSTELWYVVNLSSDSHPIHVHLVDFTVVERSPYTWNNNDPKTNVFDPSKFTLANVEAGARLPVDANAVAPKDTVRVDPGQMMGIAVNFSPFPGRYMYHCHILEHEDHDMMRPFIVVPEWVPHDDM